MSWANVAGPDEPQPLASQVVEFFVAVKHELPMQALKSPCHMYDDEVLKLVKVIVDDSIAWSPNRPFDGTGLIQKHKLLIRLQ